MTRSLPQVAETIQAATVAKVGAVAGKAAEEAKLDEAAVETFLKQDASLQGLPPMDAGQTQAVSASIVTITAPTSVLVLLPLK